MIAKSNNSLSQTTARKAYRKPTLVKAGKLSAVVAEDSSVSGAPYCWVARAAFGESDIRWMIFRAWLVDDAPVWLRSLYIRYGEAVGAWLAGRDNARTVVRAMMVPAINRKLKR